MDIKTARKQAGLTQEDLAKLVGTDQGTVSAIESGARSISDGLARKLGGVLEPSGDELIIENRARAMERAIAEGDRAGVLSAAKTVVEIASRHALTPVGAWVLDDLVDRAVKFTQDANAAYPSPRSPLSLLPLPEHDERRCGSLQDEEVRTSGRDRGGGLGGRAAAV